MILQDILPPEFIKVDLEAEDKDEAFEELVDFFCQAVKSSNRSEILKAVYEREAKMSTGIHKGIAVPHGKTTAVKNICGVLGISRKGIIYDALDGQPVYLVFMILIPREDTEQHLRILKHLACLVENPQFKIDLQLQKDPQNAYKIIRKYEELLTDLG
jgi:PTS system fructose-specific IIC component/PTS system nitrogen regulatory IIA component